MDGPDIALLIFAILGTIAILLTLFFATRHNDATGDACDSACRPYTVEKSEREYFSGKQVRCICATADPTKFEEKLVEVK